MRQLPDDLVAFFHSFMPRTYLEQVLRALFQCYDEADGRCHAVFDKPELARVRSAYRRGLIEGQLRTVAAEFPNVEAEPRTSPASGWYHTLVLAGRVAFTQNAVGCPDEIVRPSLFRMLYAGSDNQKYLFPDMAPRKPGRPKPSAESILYGILIHGAANQRPAQLAFARIVFPKEDLEANWPAHVDLFQEFPHVVQQYTERPAASERAVEEVSVPEPTLRISRTEAGG